MYNMTKYCQLDYISSSVPANHLQLLVKRTLLEALGFRGLAIAPAAPCQRTKFALFPVFLCIGVPKVPGYVHVFVV